MSPLEQTLRRQLHAAAESATPSPTALEEIRAGIAARPSLITLFRRALRRR